MAFWKDKVEHVYTPYSSLLYQDMPPLIKQSLVGCITNNRNLSRDMVANITSGILTKARAYYRQALKEDHPWGLPDGSMTFINPTMAEKLRPILIDDLGIKGEQVLAIRTCTISRDGGDYQQYTVDYRVFIKRPEGENWFEDNDDLPSFTEGTWTYNTKQAKYPTLDLLVTKFPSQYYPITPLRINNVNLGEKDQPHRDTIYRALRCLDLKLDQLYEDFDTSAKESGTETPDDIFIVLSVSVATKKQRSLEYLWRYWQDMYDISPTKKADYEYWLNTQKGHAPLPTTNLQIKDSRFIQELAWDYVSKRVFKAKIGRVNHYESEYLPNSGVVTSGGFRRATGSISYRKQINAEEVEEYTVHGIVCSYQVAAGNWISVSLQEAFAEPEDAMSGQCFTIPVRLDICKEMGNIHSHDLLYEAIRLHSNDRSEYTVKWYQRGFFKVVILVAAVAITIVTQGATTPLLSMAMAGILITNVVIPMIVMAVVTPMLQDILGEEIGFLLTLVAMAYGVGFDVSALGEGLSAAVTVAGTSTLSVVNAAMYGIGALNNAYSQNQMEKIQTESEALDEQIEEFYADELQKTYNLNQIHNGVKGDPWDLLQPDTYVRRVLAEPRLPLLITETVSSFFDLTFKEDVLKPNLRIGH